jgi:hypothetical protein
MTLQMLHSEFPTIWGKFYFSILSVHRDQEIVVVVLYLTFVLFQTRAQLDSSHGRHPPEAPVRGRLPLLHLRLPRVLRMTRHRLPAVNTASCHIDSCTCRVPGLSSRPLLMIVQCTYAPLSLSAS